MFDVARFVEQVQYPELHIVKTLSKNELQSLVHDGSPPVKAS